MELCNIIATEAIKRAREVGPCAFLKMMMTSHGNGGKEEQKSDTITSSCE